MSSVISGLLKTVIVLLLKYHFILLLLFSLNLSCLICSCFVFIVLAFIRDTAVYVDVFGEPC